MNWTCLVYGAPMLGAMIWWFVDARKWFKGPKVNIEHLMLGRGENVVEGQDSKMPIADAADESDGAGADSKAIEVSH
jgi:hypothetical protein